MTDLDRASAITYEDFADLPGFGWRAVLENPKGAFIECSYRCGRVLVKLHDGSGVGYQFYLSEEAASALRNALCKVLPC